MADADDDSSSSIPRWTPQFHLVESDMNDIMGHCEDQMGAIQKYCCTEVRFDIDYADLIAEAVDNYVRHREIP